MSLRKLAAALALVACSATAEAQVSRVFVSVDGNDANVCSNVATPCRTLAGGITQVDAQGEVIVIDSGSYAGGTITKSVKINVPAGIVAFSGLPIVVNPGTAGTVVLRGLTLKAATVGAGIGIDHQSGTLFLENMVVDGWSDGLRVGLGGSDRLFVKGSVFRNNANDGLRAIGGLVEVDGSFFERNAHAGTYFVFGGSGRFSNSTFTGNGTGAATTGPGIDVTFQRCEVSANLGDGLQADFTSIIRVGQSTVVRNGNGGLDNFGNTATLQTFGNNIVRGNGTDTIGNITTVTLQ